MSLTEKYLGESAKVPANISVDRDSQYELKITTMEDVMNDTPLMRRKTVFKGTPEEMQKFVDKKKLVWKDSRKMMFGGYFYDKKNGEAYMPV